MKIVGVMGCTLTVQMRTDEFSAITGIELSNTRYCHPKYGWVDLSPSTEFTTRDGWLRLHSLNNNRKELEKAQRQLRAIADVLEPLEMVVGVEPPEPSQEEVPTAGH